MNSPTTPPNADTPPENVNPPARDDAGKSAPDASGASPKYIRPKRRTVIIMALVALLAICLILSAWKLGPFKTPVVETENAYVRGAVTVLAPQVNGYVADVLVKDFQYVKAGQVLVRIDARIYRQRVEQAIAQRETASAQLKNATQTLAQNAATLAANRADLVAVRAEEGRSLAELARVEELSGRGSVSLNERDRVRAAARLASANVLKAQAQIDIAIETVKATEVSRGGLEAQVRTAQAQVALAQIDLDNTVIKAPRDGQVSEASVRLGQYVTAGSQLLFLVPDNLWIVANFKENQIWNMRIGQKASFAVDAFEGAALTGRVDQLAPATGSEFSVLRPDNASGNFTKVVQRLPIRIAIDPDQPLAKQLRPGMSVLVKVDTASAGGSAQ